jgi:DNA-binding Lrp family transcriptional regulator
MPTHTLDSTDRKILGILQTDASITNVELARRVHLSASPCLARVKALEPRCSGARPGGAAGHRARDTGR